ncbi:Gfo/Idh/MocA family protein [Haloarchaeobius sp. HME9146]|uniref:Gfo/Idh/MocA family protein n=1 Tax=Haloarchaeobius sp. HME9146 TaxID=2978732 RepID=UPI0021C0A110|nr:Gfo/Idh/MocA family oxidoreductase [Haloarchaeobius sp. HME9146]MCT9098029.1 Gfo/Idh/MocA family oxidoreductase [Haloarchaeobius sp. HME9146]
MNVGYIGLDHHHRDPYLETLAQLPVDVTAACEPNPAVDTTDIERLEETPVYESVDALLEAESLDAVWITLSNRDTPAAIQQALDHGVNVYTEKPVARTAAELDPVIEAERASEAIVCVSYPWRNHPFATELTRRRADGFFGALRSVEARFVASALAHRDTEHFLFDAEMSRGGILQWLGIHWLDLLPAVLDSRIETVTARTARHTPSVDVEDSATLQFELAGGTLCTLTTGYYLDEGCYDTDIRIRGSAGTARWDPIGHKFGFSGETTLELTDLQGRWETPARSVRYEYADTPGYGGGWGYAFAEQFLSACEESGPVPVSLQDAQRVLRVLDAAYESAETGRTVRVLE